MEQEVKVGRHRYPAHFYHQEAVRSAEKRAQLEKILRLANEKRWIKDVA